MNFQFFTSRISSDSTKRFFGYDFRDGENITHEGQGEYSANLFSRKAVDIIQDSAKGRDKDKPLFLYLSFQSIHKPIQVSIMSMIRINLTKFGIDPRYRTSMPGCISPMGSWRRGPGGRG